MFDGGGLDLFDWGIVFEVYWGFGNFSREVEFAVLDDAITYFLYVEFEPHGGVALAGVAGGTVGVDTIGLEEAVVLGEFLGVARLVDCVGHAAEFSDD